MRAREKEDSVATAAKIQGVKGSHGGRSGSAGLDDA